MASLDLITGMTEGQFSDLMRVMEKAGDFDTIFSIGWYQKHGLKPRLMISHRKKGDKPELGVFLVNEKGEIFRKSEDSEYAPTFKMRVVGLTFKQLKELADYVPEEIRDEFAQEMKERDPTFVLRPKHTTIGPKSSKHRIEIFPAEERHREILGDKFVDMSQACFKILEEFLEHIDNFTVSEEFAKASPKGLADVVAYKLWKEGDTPADTARKLQDMRNERKARWKDAQNPYRVNMGVVEMKGRNGEEGKSIFRLRTHHKLFAGAPKKSHARVVYETQKRLLQANPALDPDGLVSKFFDQHFNAAEAKETGQWKFKGEDYAVVYKPLDVATPAKHDSQILPADYHKLKKVCAVVSLVDFRMSFCPYDASGKPRAFEKLVCDPAMLKHRIYSNGYPGNRKGLEDDEVKGDLDFLKKPAIESGSKRGFEELENADIDGDGIDDSASVHSDHCSPSKRAAIPNPEANPEANPEPQRTNLGVDFFSANAEIDD